MTRRISWLPRWRIRCNFRQTSGEYLRHRRGFCDLFQLSKTLPRCCCCDRAQSSSTVLGLGGRLPVWRGSSRSGRSRSVPVASWPHKWLDLPRIRAGSGRSGTTQRAFVDEPEPASSTDRYRCDWLSYINWFQNAKLIDIDCNDCRGSRSLTLVTTTDTSSRMHHHHAGKNYPCWQSHLNNEYSYQHYSHNGNSY